MVGLFVSVPLVLALDISVFRSLSYPTVKPEVTKRPQSQLASAAGVVVSFHGMGNTGKQGEVFEPLWHSAGLDVIRVWQPGEIYDADMMAARAVREVGCPADVIFHGISMGGQAARLAAIQLHQTCGARTNVMVILDNAPYGEDTLVNSQRDLAAEASWWLAGPLSNQLGLHRGIGGASERQSAMRWGTELHSFAGVAPTPGELSFARVVLLVSDKDRSTIRLQPMIDDWRISAPRLKLVHSATDHATYAVPEDRETHQQAMREAIDLLKTWRE